MPLARIAFLRTLAHLFIPVDFFLPLPGGAHAAVPTGYYQPLLVAQRLPLPAPTSTIVHVVQWGLVLAASAAATGRAPRLLGTAVFRLYFEWMVVAMSYGKVDHDRYAFLIPLRSG